MPSSRAYFDSRPTAFRAPDYRAGTVELVSESPWHFKGFDRSLPFQPDSDPHQNIPWSASGSTSQGHPPTLSMSKMHNLRSNSKYDPKPRSSPELYTSEQDSTTSRDSLDLFGDVPSSRTSASMPRSQIKGHSQRRPPNRDEFDGPHQFLDRLSPDASAAQERELPHMPTNLLVQEQDDVLNQVNDRLSQCAFDFVAKYQFPIPLEADKRPVRVAQDREWTEWVYLLKRLATKRRIPARVLYNGQIKQLVTVLENSLEMRHAAKHQSRPLKDDRNVLQLISAGLQVAKILKDAASMEYLDKLYIRTERLIQSRRGTPAYLG